MRPGYYPHHSMAPASPPDRSTWHSPVPYLFGGLAAMLGLIAFALLILACSYWRLSGFLDPPPGDDTSSSAGDRKPAGPTALKPTPYLEEGFVVIMAGDVKPTFIATPVTARASSFEADHSGSSGGSSSSGKLTKPDEEGKGGDGNHLQLQ